MTMRTGWCALLVVVATLAAHASEVGAGERESGKATSVRSANPRPVPPPASGRPARFYGVPVTPAVYFVNFLLLYISNPNEAAEMPAYRTPLPAALSDCLESNPTGCPYADYARSFDDRATGHKACGWPTECQANPKWERMAPSVASRPEQINEPLGLQRANTLARRLGVDKSMILTDREYECTIGIPPRDEDRQIIFACIGNLTNSNGNTNIPLSSYGLAITDDPDANVPVGTVQSLCAPEAPCLVFNELFLGPLERIAAVCGWEGKLARMIRETPFVEFAQGGAACQALGGTQNGGPCIVEPACPGRAPN